MDKYFVRRIKRTSKWGVYSKKQNGNLWLHCIFNNRDDAEENCDEWNWLANEKDDRVLQAMGWA